MSRADSVLTACCQQQSQQRLVLSVSCTIADYCAKLLHALTEELGLVETANVMQRQSYEAVSAAPDQPAKGAALLRDGQQQPSEGWCGQGVGPGCHGRTDLRRAPSRVFPVKPASSQASARLMHGALPARSLSRSYLDVSATNRAVCLRDWQEISGAGK